MKIKTLKPCRNCKENFKVFKTTDAFCSAKCYKQYKGTDANNQISNRSKKRASEEKAYLALNKVFLNQEENKYCPVMQHLEGWNIRTSEVHHKAGRVGKLLLYTPYWLAVSSEGHKWIHDNPKESYKLGFLIKSSTV